MPIYIREKHQEDPAKLGSSPSEARLKQLAAALHDQLKRMTATLRQLKSEKRSLEHQVAQKDSEIRQLKQELQQLKQRGRKNVGPVDFGDW